MKCTDKFFSFILIMVTLLVSLTGCKKETTGTYDLEETSNQFQITETAKTGGADFFASGYCITDRDNFGLEQVDAHVAQGGGVFNLATGECTYGQNLFGRMYPASTTKILTCLVAIEQGDLSQMITVSSHAADQTPDSSVANLSTGDVMSLEDLLYGLMLRSGNDAAIAIAEAIGGDEEGFAKLMNERANSIGATNSHFVTPHGLHQDDHYTTIYDMYLIFQEALKNDTFVQIMSSPSYHVTYTGVDGSTKAQDWNNTNRYLLGKEKAPAGFTVVGGKTGTTYEAGYCLVLYSLNDHNQPIISIVYNADCALNLYYLMNELLYTYGEA
ncbi:MAG: serine hydrolase [Lachnospiraceae bacterium]|nr:serine hydrolase [Lachnospiraceae bacterium]